MPWPMRGIVEMSRSSTSLNRALAAAFIILGCQLVSSMKAASVSHSTFHHQRVIKATVINNIWRTGVDQLPFTSRHAS